MKALVDRIQAEAVNLGKGIIKVDGFINHQIDPALTTAMGAEFASRFLALGVSSISKIVTAEVSGIPPAFATAQALQVPLIYARKQKPATLTERCYTAAAVSRTKGNLVNLQVSSKYLGVGDRVLIIDDFLATGSTLAALADIIAQSGATLCGIGCVIEKPWEMGREKLTHLEVPIITLAQIELVGERLVVRG